MNNISDCSFELSWMNYECHAQPKMSRNVKAVISILTDANTEDPSIVIEMYDAGIITIDDIYDAFCRTAGNGLPPASDILDLLIAENRLDNKLSLSIMNGLRYSHRTYPGISDKQIELFDRIRPFISEDIYQFNFLAIPLPIVEKICPIDSMELTDDFFKMLQHSGQCADPNLMEKIIQLLLSKNMDDFEHICVLGNVIINFIINQCTSDRCGRIDPDTSDVFNIKIKYLDEFLNMIVDHPQCIYIGMNLFVRLRNDVFSGSVTKQIAKIVVDMVDCNNLLDTEEMYDLVSFYSKTLSSKSSDRMVKYHKYIRSYFDLFIDHERVYERRSCDGDDNTTTEQNERYVVLDMLRTHMDFFERCGGKNIARTSYETDMEQFIGKLCQNFSAKSLDETAIFVVNLLDLMESDIAFNEWMSSN